MNDGNDRPAIARNLSHTNRGGDRPQQPRLAAAGTTVCSPVFASR
ncbi:MAG: hypothetical protein ACO37F_10070 [Pirellulales bacterium]